MAGTQCISLFQSSPKYDDPDSHSKHDDDHGANDDDGDAVKGRLETGAVSDDCVLARLQLVIHVAVVGVLEPWRPRRGREVKHGRGGGRVAAAGGQARAGEKVGRHDVMLKRKKMMLNVFANHSHQIWVTFIGCTNIQTEKAIVFPKGR